MKGYVARRELDEAKIYVVQERNDGGVVMEPLKHVVVHSPTGFEWGYYGSGPADAALSILADYFGEQPSRKELHQGHFDITDEEFAEADKNNRHAELIKEKRVKCWYYHQFFKEAFVAKWEKEGGTVTEAQIQQWITDFELERRRQSKGWASQPATMCGSSEGTSSSPLISWR